MHQQQHYSQLHNYHIFKVSRTIKSDSPAYTAISQALPIYIQVYIKAIANILDRVSLIKITYCRRFVNSECKKWI